MNTTADKERKAAKEAAVAKQIADIAPHIGVLVGILDEWKLDLLILALGSGQVKLHNSEATP